MPSNAAGPEYPSKVLAVELGGHFLFGLAAGVLSFDRKIAVLCGAEAVVIDVDHLLGAVGLPIEARLAHSLFFIAVSATAVGLLSRRTGRPALISASVISAVFSHFSYDSFAGDGSFPLLSPFNFHFFDFPWIAWIPFEVLALSAMFIIATTRCRRSAQSDMNS